MSDNRRQFLRSLGFAGAASLLPFSNLLAFGNGNPGEGFVINEEDQETYLIGPRRAPVTIMVDKSRKNVNSFSLCREEIVPQDGIPVHKHLNEDELIYIQYGSGVFTLGEQQYQVKAGSAMYVPKGIWHGIMNNGTENIRMVFSFTPSGFENYFREIGVPQGSTQQKQFDWNAIDKKYGIVYKGR
ncbi:MAG TPA: cupin domain-containing protein [Chitinophagaceae bacterium]|nr:cupin domain-containing protein [Chitinophagaceae bacterium]